MENKHIQTFRGKLRCLGQCMYSSVAKTTKCMYRDTRKHNTHLKSHNLTSIEVTGPSSVYLRAITMHRPVSVQNKNSEALATRNQAGYHEDVNHSFVNSSFVYWSKRSPNVSVAQQSTSWPWMQLVALSRLNIVLYVQRWEHLRYPVLIQVLSFLMGCVEKTFYASVRQLGRWSFGTSLIWSPLYFFWPIITKIVLKIIIYWGMFLFRASNEKAELPSSVLMYLKVFFLLLSMISLSLTVIWFPFISIADFKAPGYHTLTTPAPFHVLLGLWFILKYSVHCSKIRY